MCQGLGEFQALGIMTKRTGVWMRKFAPRLSVLLNFLEAAPSNSGSIQSLCIYVLISYCDPLSARGRQPQLTARLEPHAGEKHLLLDLLSKSIIWRIE